MPKRISKKLVKGVTASQFEEAMGSYAEAETRSCGLRSVITDETNRIKEKYRNELEYFEDKKKGALEIIETYCIEQKETLFSKRRSIGTVHGIAGFRLGNPKLRTVRGMNWTIVLERLKEKLPGYIRTTEEPAKDLLLANRNKTEVVGALQDIGLQVVQEEIFFIELGRAA